MSDLDVSPTVSVDSYSPFTLNAAVGVTVGGTRKVTVTHSIGGIPTELVCIGTTGRPPELDMEKINEIDGRLRTVETSITRIETKLEHMPTTLQMWSAVLFVLLPVGGALWWVVQTYLAPILEKAAG